MSQYPLKEFTMFSYFNRFMVCLLIAALFIITPFTTANSTCGDSNGDELVDISDFVYLIQYCYKNGPDPWEPDTAEADGCEFLNIRDIVYLSNYIFYAGPSPICPATNPEYKSNLEPADTIRITPATLLAGDSLISIPIYYKNTRTIRGIALPLKVNIGEQIPTIDSIVLGSRLDYVGAACTTTNNVTGTINSSFLWFAGIDNSLPSGSGLLYTLYLSTDPESFNRQVWIDTLRLAPFNSPMFIEPNTNGSMPFFIGLRPDSIPFAAAVNYVTGDGPQSVFCADLDGDSYVDIATVGYLIESYYVSILRNNGNGTFGSPNNYAAGDGSKSVFGADLNGDGALDLAVANYSSNNVSILMNNNDGGFDSPIDYDAGSSPFYVFCADLDGDGDLDLAVANEGSNDVSILNNIGDGTFQSTDNYGVGYNPRSVFCADLDGDYDLDLAVANWGGDNVSILKNNGNGTFQPKVDYGVGIYPNSVFCADLDGDLDLDLAVANDSSDNVSILKNNGNGTFASAVNYGTGDIPRSVFCSDLDGDGDMDLAVANGWSDNVSILKNNGNGIFEEAVDYGVGDYTQSIFCADLDGDGDFDLATANTNSNNVSILGNLTQIPANQPPWSFHLISPGPTDDTTQVSANFVWRIPYDPNLGDQIKYDLYVSTTPGFEPPSTMVYSDLIANHYTEILEIGTYYWKVKAKDNWGAYSWSQVTFRFFNSNYISDTLTIVAFSPVDLIVTDPTGDSTSLWFNTIPNAFYDTTTDYNQDGDKDDIITIPDRLVGEYQIEVVAEPGGSGFYELGIRIDGGAPAMLTMPGGAPCPGPGEVDTFTYYAPWYKSGDATGDWVVDVGDVVYLINYLYRSGIPPDPIVSGDATCEGIVDVGDVVYLINYLFKAGPEPAC
jgi:hypothetical protein